MGVQPVSMDVERSYIKASLYRTTMLALLVAPVTSIYPNPEYAARHGIKGVWTYNSHDQLPGSCTKLGERDFTDASEDQPEPEASNNRFARHVALAIQLGANYAVGDSAASFFEYYECEAEP